MTCKDCVHFAVCLQFGCFENGIGDNTEYKTCSDFLSNKEFKPVVCGEWKLIPQGITVCSNCGSQALRSYYCGITISYTQEASNFCPHCGAKMDGEHNE